MTSSDYAVKFYRFDRLIGPRIALPCRFLPTITVDELVADVMEKHAAVFSEMWGWANLTRVEWFDFATPSVPVDRRTQLQDIANRANNTVTFILKPLVTTASTRATAADVVDVSVAQPDVASLREKFEKALAAARKGGAELSASSNMSASQLGKQSVEKLVYMKRFYDRRIPFPSSDSTAVISDAEYDAAESSFADAATHTEFVRLVTPYLYRALVGDEVPDLTTNGCVLVNSEFCDWLPVPQDDDVVADVKPDLVLTYRAFAEFTQPNIEKGQGNPMDDPRYLFGKVMTRCPLWPSMVLGVLVATKDPLSSEHIGQTLQSVMQRLPGHSRCMLFSPTSFCLMECFNGTATVAYSLRWGTPGSRAFLRDFFDQHPSPVCALLNKSLQHYRVTLPSDPSAGVYLGSGAFGHVFTVLDGDSRRRALKIFIFDGLYCGYREVCEEYNKIQAAAALGAPVIAAVPVSPIFRTKEGSSYMLTEVGTPVDVLTSKDDFYGAVMSLRAIHDKTMYHGDARLANLLRNDSNEFVWIDLREGGILFNEDALLYHQRKDLQQLCSSFLGMSLRPALVHAIQRVVAKTMNVEQLVEEVWEAFEEHRRVLADPKALEWAIQALPHLSTFVQEEEPDVLREAFKELEALNKAANS